MKTLKISLKFKRLLMVIPLLVFVASCELEESAPEAEKEAAISDELRLTLEAEQATYQGFPRVFKTLYGTRVEVVDFGDGNYALGDMILSKENFESELAGKGVWDRRKIKWPNKTILYRYSNNMPQATKNKVDNAANYITNNTDLNVRKWNNDNEGYVWVGYSESKGCSAEVGYKNKKFPGQKMNISLNCSQGTAIHEFLHVAGIIHEQNHWNRDAYVDVLFNNILTNKKSNYFKVSDADGYEISDVLDTNSIMMYGSNFFRTQEAKDNGWRSMRRVDGSTIIPNRSYMTTKDINIINAVY